MYRMSSPRHLFAAALVAWLSGAVPVLAGEQLYYDDRGDIPQQYTWDLGLYFEDEKAWDESFARLEALLPAVEEYRGRVTESPATLAAALGTVMELNRLLGPLYVNAHQKIHLVRGDELGAEQAGRVTSLNARVGEAVSFIEPEIAAMPEKRIAQFREAGGTAGVSALPGQYLAPAPALSLPRGGGSGGGLLATGQRPCQCVREPELRGYSVAHDRGREG